MFGNVESRKIVATIAEGVEEPETAALLRLGCEVGQGWLSGRPGPAEAAGAMLQRRTGVTTCIA